MNKLLLIVLSLMMVSCGDKEEEEDKVETHTVTFKNISDKIVLVRDNSGSAEQLFGQFNLQVGEFKSITYKCEDCPEFAFYWEFGGGFTSCVCSEGEADYTIGHCPGTFGGDDPEVECKTCVSNTIGSTADPCNR